MSSEGAHVYTSQTISLTGSAVRRIPVASRVAQLWVQLPLGNPLPAADGLTTDPLGRLVLATGSPASCGASTRPPVRCARSNRG